MSLDVKTLLVVIVALSLLDAAALAFIAWRRHPALRPWALGPALQGFGYMLLGLRGQAPDWLTIVVANGVTIASISMYIVGIARLQGVTPPWRAAFVPVAVQSVAFAFLLDDIRSRLIVGALVMAWLIGHMLHMLWRRRRVTPGRGQYVLIVACIPMLVMLLARLVVTATGMVETPSLTHANLMQSALFMTSAMSLVLVAVGSVMMVQDRTEEALRRSEARLRFRSRVFERLADGMSLPDLMDVLCRELAVILPHLRGMVMARDPQDGTLRPLAAPGVAPPLLQALQHVEVAPGQPAGGAALADCRREVIVDIEQDAAWVGLRAAARDAGVRACWSFPVTLSDGQRPAAIVVLVDQARGPDDQEADILASGARLVGIAFERHAAAERLATSERHYRLVVENAQEGICVVQDQVLRFVNQRHAELLGRDVDDLVGCHIAEHTHPEDLARGLDNDRRRQAGEDAEQDYDLRLLTRHRGARWFRMSGTPFTWEGRPATLNFFTDVTERRELEERIRHLAFHDPLTNLPNRRLLVDRLHLGVARSRRNGAHGALVFLDLDRFKALNDRHGHEAGDRFLVEVSRRLREGVRETDTVARFGGDEFVVLLGDLPLELEPAREDVRRIARKLLDRLGEPYRIVGPGGVELQHHCTASVGAVMFDDADVDVDTLMSSADTAMYRAKQAGGDRLCLLEPGGTLSMPA